MNLENLLGETILDALERQDFADWYAPDGPFERFIQHADDAPSRDDILKDINRLFALRLLTIGLRQK